MITDLPWLLNWKKLKEARKENGKEDFVATQMTGCRLRLGGSYGRDKNWLVSGKQFEDTANQTF